MKRKDLGVKLCTIGNTTYYTRRLLGANAGRQRRLFQPVEVLSVTKDYSQRSPVGRPQLLPGKYRSFSEAQQYLLYYVPVGG